MCQNEATYSFPTKVIQMLTKQMSSFEVLSWGSLKKLSPFVVKRDSFDLVLKPSEDSDSFRETLSQLEKPFKYLIKFSCNFLEPLVFKGNLLLRFLLALIGLWLMNGIFTYLHKFNKTLFVGQYWKQLPGGYHLSHSSLNLLLIVRLLVEFCQKEHRLYLREI